MAESASSNTVQWYCPQRRGQLSIRHMHIPRRLKKNLRQMKINGAPYIIKINSDFKRVIESCAMETQSRSETWINQSIIDAYIHLHREGYAHSVECWQEDQLVGGLYGISMGSAFFGESMFSSQRDASKVCLVHLAARLHKAGYTILDTQFTNDHLTQFGVFEIEHEDYMEALSVALKKPCLFTLDITEQDIITAYLNR